MHGSVTHHSSLAAIKCTETSVWQLEQLEAKNHMSAGAWRKLMGHFQLCQKSSENVNKLLMKPFKMKSLMTGMQNKDIV